MSSSPSTVIVGHGEPVYMIPETDDEGRSVTRLVIGDDADTPEDQWRARAFALVGAWSDMDWDEMESGLEEIRQSSRPTPPIDDL